MSDINTLEDSNKEAVVHTNKVLATALSVLEDIVKGNTDRFQALTLGHKTILRDGMRRPVNYAEVDDGSGSTLRIEVYCK